MFLPFLSKLGAPIVRHCCCCMPDMMDFLPPLSRSIPLQPLCSWSGSCPCSGVAHRQRASPWPRRLCRRRWTASCPSSNVRQEGRAGVGRAGVGMRGERTRAPAPAPSPFRHPTLAALQLQTRRARSAELLDACALLLERADLPAGFLGSILHAIRLVQAGSRGWGGFFERRFGPGIRSQPLLNTCSCGRQTRSVMKAGRP